MNRVNIRLRLGVGLGILDFFIHITMNYGTFSGQHHSYM